jgi:alpha-beta hydrolase superfamily lysophospholipase
VWRLALLATALAGAAAVTAGSGMLERLAYMPTRGTPPPPAGVEEVRFSSADGTGLHGWFLPAAGDRQGERALGAVLAVHGNAGNVSNHVGFVDFLPPRGFHVLLFDYRGYGRSDRGRLRRPELYSDTEAALDALLARPEAEPGRVAIFAQSLGTAFGAHLMASRREPRAAVLVSPFYSWQEMAASAFGGARPGPLARLAGRLFIRPGFDPAEAVGRIEDRPLLIVHGTEDRIVPFDHAERMARAAGANLTLRAVEGGSHNGLPWEAPELAVEIARFLEGALTAEGAPQS